ncbi:MAG: hypothetical protein ACLFUT_03805 [Desulfobacteraceae bacterium]
MPEHQGLNGAPGPLFYARVRVHELPFQLLGKLSPHRAFAAASVAYEDNIPVVNPLSLAHHGLIPGFPLRIKKAVDALTAHGFESQNKSQSIHGQTSPPKIEIKIKALPGLMK